MGQYVRELKIQVPRPSAAETDAIYKRGLESGRFPFLKKAEETKKQANIKHRFVDNYYFVEHPPAKVNPESSSSSTALARLDPGRLRHPPPRRGPPPPDDPLPAGLPRRRDEAVKRRPAPAAPPDRPPRPRPAAPTRASRNLTGERRRPFRKAA